MLIDDNNNYEFSSIQVAWRNSKVISIVPQNGNGDTISAEAGTNKILLNVTSFFENYFFWLIEQGNHRF